MIDEALDGGFDERWCLPAGRDRGERARPAAPILLSLFHSRGSVALAMPATNDRQSIIGSRRFPV
jgi:hypothetical protein